MKNFSKFCEEIGLFDALIREDLSVISKQEAIDRGYFGPVWHGTTPARMEQILKHGFKRADETDAENGYRLDKYSYSESAPPPIHHLGFGTYFTTSKTIAKLFNRGTAKGLREFYLDVPRLETINFASTNTMMKWWRKNGYDYDPDKGLNQQEWLRATKHLTEVLSSRSDAVWFKGKSIYRTLDGDQICVYDPSRIYMVDPKPSSGLEIGAKVKKADNPARTEANWRENNQIAVGTRGMITGKRAIPDQAREYDKTLQNTDKHFFTVKWTRGGTKYNYTESDLEPVK